MEQLYESETICNCHFDRCISPGYFNGNFIVKVKIPDLAPCELSNFSGVTYGFCFLQDGILSNVLCVHSSGILVLKCVMELLANIFSSLF